MSEPYNYRHFPADLDAEVFAAFRDAVRLGDKGADGILVDASTGAETSLKAIRGKRPVMIEFGSYS